MSKFRLHDWNDVRLLIACADHGSFAAAAAALGVDQTTVSRRIGQLEEALGRPLFNRRRSGARPTGAGLALLERARVMEAAAAGFEGAMAGLTAFPPPKVTIAASEGLLTYTLIPALLGTTQAPLPLDRGLIRRPLPDLAFTTSYDNADIAIIATNPGEGPPVRGAWKVRRVGTMSFVPVASQGFLESHPPISSFDDLINLPLMDIAIYGAIRGLQQWNALVAGKREREEKVLVAPTTPALHKPLLAGQGVTILPPYSALYERRIVVIDVPAPSLCVALWLIAHEDTLREPTIRELYDSLAEMFLKSRWFRA